MRVQGTARIDTQGSLQTTGNALDLALDGDGYFQVQMPGGQFGYTRAGNFSRSPEGMLVTSEGYQVMPGITVPEGATAITIGADGTVSATLPGQAEARQLGQIQIASFANPAGLQATGDNYLIETGASARPAWASPARKAAARSARACSKDRTSTSSRNWST